MSTTQPVLLLLAALVACACGGGHGHGGSDTVPTRPIEQVLADHTPALMRIPGVTGTAQSLCSGAPCIQVLVRADTPELRGRIPERLEGYPVRLEVTGVIRPRRDTT